MRNIARIDRLISAGLHRLRYESDMRLLNSLLASTLGVVSCSFIGCSPVMDMRYTLTPPDSTSGLRCAAECDASRSQCEELEQAQGEQCGTGVEFDKKACSDALARAGKRERWYDCLPASCSVDNERCEQNYFRCYRSCGGRVEAEQVCVSNCES